MSSDFQVYMGGNGRGIEIVDGNTYEGHFKDGLAEGHGKKTWITGECYIGEWRDGLRHGKGECTYQGGKMMKFVLCIFCLDSFWYDF